MQRVERSGVAIGRHAADDAAAIRQGRAGAGPRRARGEGGSAMTAEATATRRRRASACTGSAGDRTSANARGARCARTTAPAATPGNTSRTTTPGRAPIDGTRTAWPASAIAQQTVCFALALWNEQDPILKERLFGLTGNEGNHGEDVKEYYFYLDSTPTHSYMKYLYKYPQRAFPVRASSSRRTAAAARQDPEFELRRHRRLRRQPLLRRVRRVREGIARRHPDPHHGRQPRPSRGAAARAAHGVVPQHVVVGADGARPQLAPMARRSPRVIELQHPESGRRTLVPTARRELLFTENETNARRLFGGRNARRHSSRTASTITSSTARTTR